MPDDLGFVTEGLAHLVLIPCARKGDSNPSWRGAGGRQEWDNSVLICSRGKYKFHPTGTDVAQVPPPPASLRPLPTNSPFISHVDYKCSFDKGAFWVSDNRIIILLKSVLIVSKLLVIVSSPGDFRGGGIGNKHI